MSTTSAPRHAVALRTGLAALLALATALTAWRPDWIEAVGLGDPDGGSGMVEAAIVAVLGAVTVITATWAWRAWALMQSSKIDTTSRGKTKSVGQRDEGSGTAAA